MELTAQVAFVLFTGTPILVLTSVFDGVAIERARRSMVGRCVATAFGLAAVYVLGACLVVITGGTVTGFFAGATGTAAFIVLGSVGGELITRIWLDDSEIRMRSRNQAQWSLQTVVPGTWELRYEGKRAVRAVTLTLKSDDRTHLVPTRDNDILRNDTFRIDGPEAKLGAQVTIIYVQRANWKMWRGVLA